MMHYKAFSALIYPDFDDAFAHGRMQFVNKHDVHEGQRLHALQRLRAGNLHLPVGPETPVAGHQHAMVNAGAVQVRRKLLHQNAALANEHHAAAFVHGRSYHVFHDSALACAGGCSQDLAGMIRAEPVAKGLD